PFVGDDPGSGASLGLALRTGNAERMRITEDGNVAIGTTTPWSSLPGTLQRSLDVDGWIVASGSAGNSWGDPATRIGVRSDDGAGFWLVSAYPTDGHFAIHQAMVGDRLTVTTAGNVGIGTTSPAYALDVNGSARFAGMQPFLKGGNNGTASCEVFCAGS